jgi:formiminoglutamate deiminase
MKDREILCESVLTPCGWIDQARICIDDAGFITGVSALRDGESRAGLRGHVVPGMPNLHSHAFQRQMAGLTEASGAETDSFWTWRELMYGLADRMTPEALQAIAALLQVEMLEAGYTACAEFHYLHHQAGGQPFDNPAEMSNALIEAADGSGMALTLLPVLYCRGGFTSDSVSARQQRFHNSPEQFMRLLSACGKLIRNRPLHQLGIAPHSLRAVSQDQLQMVLDTPEAQGLPVHIHIAEQTAEVEECLSVLGARPVNWLLDHFAINSHWCLVHATHLERNELDLAAASGATAGLCPTTEADLADGFFEAGRWLDKGGSFGIGSDSNLRVSVAEELRLLEFGCRLRTHRRNVLARNGESCGRTLYQGAALGGARALGQPTGRIEAGCRADLVELDAHHPLLEGRRHDAVLDTWLFAGGSAMVRSAWVAGTLCVSAGRHKNRDRIEAAGRQAMRGLL